MELYLAQWRWIAPPGLPLGWYAPRRDMKLGQIDLRGPFRSGLPGPTPEGYGIFAYQQQDAAIGDYLGDGLGSLLSSQKLSTISRKMGLGEAITVPDAQGLIKLLSIQYSDPAGEVSWKPLGGSPQQGLRFILGNQTYIDPQPFDTNHPAWPGTIAVWQADYRRNRQEGITPLQVLQRMTGYAMLKYRVSADVMLPPEYRQDGSIEPKTTITESFNTGDSDTLGPDLSWTELSGAGWAGDWDIVSNQAKAINGGDNNNTARADSDLSTADHYAQVQVAAFGVNAGVMFRKDSTATKTYYLAVVGTNYVQTGKQVAGSFTELDLTVVTFSANALVESQVSTNTLTTRYDGTQRFSGDDTDVTGNVRTGLQAFNADGVVDVFEAADLAAVSSIPYYYRMYGKGQN